MAEPFEEPAQAELARDAAQRGAENEVGRWPSRLRTCRGMSRSRQLEYLLALARERHFSRAAAACHVSQSALSAAICKMEVELGVTIIERGHRFTGFTAEGAQVVEWAERMLTKRDALRFDLIRMHHGITDTLRVGVIPTAAPVAALLTIAFHERNPRSRLRIDTSSSREIVQRLARFDLDAGLVYLDEHPIPGAHGFQLYRERYILLTAANERPAW